MQTKTSRAKKLKAAKKKVRKRGIPGGVTHWQVVRARIQGEVTTQVGRRGFAGTVILEPGKLDYEHGGESGVVSQADLERFAASMREKGLAVSASTDGKHVTIRLTTATIAILGGRKANPSVKPAPSKQQPPTLSKNPPETPKLVIPTPDKLLIPILSNVAVKERRYVDVRKRVAAHFSVPPEKVTFAFVDSETRERSSFAHSFNLAVRHLVKATFIKANGKMLVAAPGSSSKSLPPYEAPTEKKAKRSARQSITARHSGEIDVQRLVKGIPDRDPYELLRTWKNAVRILSDKSRSHQHAQAQVMASAIAKEWERRAKSLADDAYFRWPTTDANGRRRKEHYRDLQEEGMLKYLEYKVGKEGGHSSFRHSLLSKIFENALPPVFDRLYMAEWGPNGSSIRLHKMAHCLASFARNFKYQDNDRYDEAIRHWEQDLEYLHDRYYVGKFGFGWPSTAI